MLVKVIISGFIGLTLYQLNRKNKKSIPFYRRILFMYIMAMTSTVVLSQTYKIVDAGQTKCFDSVRGINPPLPGQLYYGQDAQFLGNQRSYNLSTDGKTVYDNNTKLTWMRGPNITDTHPVRTDKMDIDQAQLWVVTVNNANYGGYSDWRIPTIKELYSLYDARGTDPSGYYGTDLSVLRPFIDTVYFHFGWGQTDLGERLIDSQYGTNTKFILDPSGSGSTKLFGVNFSDGRIKGYDLIDALSHIKKTFFWQLVRGDTVYGKSQLVDNNDQTITDVSTGLMWSKNDNGSALTWKEALTWVQQKNAENYLGHNDWRMPDAKELHSLVNYANAPDYNGLPSINTNFFICSMITNENGQDDYPYYWSSSTHMPCSTDSSGSETDYIAFGRAMGWPTTVGHWIDVHGSGAQRSDPKTGPPFPYATVHTVVVNGHTYTGYSWGPQGDAIRGLNYLRLVRGIPTSINEYKSNKSIKVYPNPFTNMIKLVNTNGVEFYKLIDITGQTIWTGMEIEKQDFSSLLPGAYFLKVNDLDSEKTIKLIKK